MVRVSGCAEAKSLGDWNEPELEDVGMEDCSCKVALVSMMNSFRTAHKDWCRVLRRGLLLE